MAKDKKPPSQRKKKTARVQKIIGYDPKTGKPIKKSFYGKSKTEATKKRDEYNANVLNGSNIESSDILFKDWLRSWIHGRRYHIDEGVQDYYKTVIERHIIPKLGDKNIEKLNTREVQEFINQKYENGRLDGKGGLSRAYIKHIYLAIKKSLDQAVKERKIAHNVCDGVELPKENKTNKENPLSWEETCILVNTAKKQKHQEMYYAIKVALGSGLRRGEILGLRNKDVDFDNQFISVNQQYVKNNSGHHFKPPKNYSIRTIPVSNIVIDSLKQQVKNNNRNKEILKENYIDYDLIFCQEDGRPHDTRNFTKRFDRLNKRAGIKKVKFHDLRHTFATLCLERGMDLKAIQVILGHKSVTVTGDVYVHATQKSMSRTTHIIDDVFTEIEKTSDNESEE